MYELVARDGVTVGYTTLRRFASRELGWRQQAPRVRLDDPPAGQEAQIDFGLMARVTDVDGKKRRLWALIVTLSLSRCMHVWPTFTQTKSGLSVASAGRLTSTNAGLLFSPRRLRQR
jgi:hypothetical protein